MPRTEVLLRSSPARDAPTAYDAGRVAFPSSHSSADASRWLPVPRAVGSALSLDGRAVV